MKYYELINQSFAFYNRSNTYTLYGSICFFFIIYTLTWAGFREVTVPISSFHPPAPSFDPPQSTPGCLHIAPSS